MEEDFQKKKDAVCDPCNRKHIGNASMWLTVGLIVQKPFEMIALRFRLFSPISITEQICVCSSTEFPGSLSDSVH